MKTAFTASEQVPLWILRMFALRKGVHFRAFYDGDTFCGILYTAESEKYVFVLFLVINDEIRSKGYGSRILQWLKSNSSKEIALNVERPDSSASDALQRTKRIEFYKKNGITDTGYAISIKNDWLAVLSSDAENFDVHAYSAVVNGLFFGSYKGRIFKR